MLNMASAHVQVIEGLVEEEALGSYVLVEKADVLDAIGTFVAAYLATVPEAQHMKPAELQQALTTTFRVGPLCMQDEQYEVMVKPFGKGGGGGGGGGGGKNVGPQPAHGGFLKPTPTPRG